MGKDFPTNLAEIIAAYRVQRLLAVTKIRYRIALLAMCMECIGIQTVPGYRQ